MAKRLTQIDKDWISDNYNQMTDEKMADILGCSSETVRRNRSKMGLKKNALPLNKPQDKFKSYEEMRDMDVENRVELFRSQLNKSSRGTRIKILLGEDYPYFEDEWIAFHLQLPDLTHTEQINIEQVIMLRLRIDENQKSYRKYLLFRESLLESHGDPSQWNEEDRNDPEKIGILANYVEIDSRISDFNTEYQKLLEKLGGLEKNLNLTREQREKAGRVQEQNFFTLCKSLEDKKKRRAEGRFAEYARISTEKTKEKLRESITFLDDEVHPQLLDSRTIERIEQQEESE